MKSNKPRGLFITGTDTGVGKTYVTEQILNQLSSQSISCVAMKPVACGATQTPNGLRNADAMKLQQASSVEVPYELLNPYCFEPEIAPHLAAQQAGVAIELSIILSAFEALSLLSDVIIVEGLGGWQVPLNLQSAKPLFISTLAAQLQLPVVLVVALQLGCLNHALLNYHTIYNSECSMAGWVANRLNKNFISADACVETLEKQITAPLLAYLSHADDKFKPNSSINDDVFDLDHLLINS